MKTTITSLSCALVASAMAFTAQAFDYVQVENGVSYSCEAYNNGPTLFLKYSPTEKGDLTIKQTGSTDNHLYNSLEAADAMQNQVGNVGGESPIGEPETIIYEGLAAGDYYFVAPFNAYDELTSVVFEFTVSQEGEGSDEPGTGDGGDYPALKMDVVTTIVPGTLYALTPATDGTLKIATDQYVNFDLDVYTDSSKENVLTPDVAYGDNGKVVTYSPDVEAGHTYYVEMTADWLDPISSMEVTPYVAAGAGITNVYPEAGSVYDYTTAGIEIQISAAGGISSIEDATFSYTVGNEVVTVPLENNTEYLKVNGAPGNEFIQAKLSISGSSEYTNYVQQAAEAGADSFTLTIFGVKSGNELISANLTDNENVTVYNGTVSVTYKLANAPKYLADESTWPSTFYSYWQEGDESAVATLVFDQEIASVDEVSVIMGRTQPGDISELDSYIVPASVSGNTVVIDFAGVTRTASTSTVTVYVQTVKGTTGIPVNFGQFTSTLVEYIAYSSEEAPAPEPAPSVSIKNAYADDITTTSAKIYVEYDAEAVPEGATVYASAFSMALRMPITVTVTESPAVIELSGLESESEYSFIISMGINDAEGETIFEETYAENVEFTTAGPSVTIDKVTTDNEDSSVHFTLNYTAENIPADAKPVVKVSYNEVEAEEVEYTQTEEGVIEFTISDLEDGSYVFTITLEFANEEGYVYAYSEEVSVADEVSGIGAISINGASNARIYNLQGVEVNNPANGTVVIMVAGDKATKVIVK